MTEPCMLGNCAILEQTSDGVRCGRCYFHVENGICPRHGDVSAVQERYKKLGKLTLEDDHYNSSKRRAP